MEKLTVKEALEQGYEFFGNSTESGWLGMYDIKDFRAEDATGSERLFKKDPERPFSTDAESVKEILVDELSTKWYDESHDDTDEMDDFLKAIPVEKFNDIAGILNEAMSNKHTYKLEEIQLIP